MPYRVILYNNTPVKVCRTKEEFIFWCKSYTKLVRECSIRKLECVDLAILNYVYLLSNVNLLIPYEKYKGLEAISDNLYFDEDDSSKVKYHDVKSLKELYDERADLVNKIKRNNFRCMGFNAMMVP